MHGIIFHCRGQMLQVSVQKSKLLTRTKAGQVPGQNADIEESY
jgi:hypothetical protein